MDLEDMMSNVASKLRQLEDREATKARQSSKPQKASKKNPEQTFKPRMVVQKGSAIHRVFSTIPKRLSLSLLLHLSSLISIPFPIHCARIPSVNVSQQLIFSYSRIAFLCVDRLRPTQWLHITSFPPDVWKKYVECHETRISPLPKFKLLLTHLSNDNPSCLPRAIFQFESPSEAAIYLKKIQRLFPSQKSIARQGASSPIITRQRGRLSIKERVKPVAESKHNPNCRLVHFDRIPSHLSHSDLVTMCSSFGDVVRGQIHRDEEGFRTGLAVVEMATSKMAWKVSEHFNHGTKMENVRTSSTASGDATWNRLDAFTPHYIQIEPVPLKWKSLEESQSETTVIDQVYNALSAQGMEPSFISFYPSTMRYNWNPKGQRKLSRVLIRFEDQGDVFQAISCFEKKSKIGGIECGHKLNVKYLSVDPFADTQTMWCWVRMENVPNSMTPEMLRKGIEHNGFEVVDIILLKSPVYPNRVMIRCMDRAEAKELATKMNGSVMMGHKIWTITVRGYNGTDAMNHGIPTSRVIVYPVPLGTTKGSLKNMVKDIGVCKNVSIAWNANMYPSHATLEMLNVSDATVLVQAMNEAEECEMKLGEERVRAVQLRESELEIKRRQAEKEEMYIRQGKVVPQKRKKGKRKLKMDRDWKRKGGSKLLSKDKRQWPKWKRQIYWPAIKGRR